MLLTLLFALWAIPYSSVKTKRNLVFVNKEEGKKYCCLQWPCLSLHKRTNKKCHVDESVCKGRLHVYWNCVCVCVCVCVCGGVHSMGVFCACARIQQVCVCVCVHVRVYVCVWLIISTAGQELYSYCTHYQNAARDLAEKLPHNYSMLWLF